MFVCVLCGRRTESTCLQSTAAAKECWVTVNFGFLSHFFALFKEKKNFFSSVKILLPWQLAENEIFYPMTFVEAGVRADLRGYSGYFSFRDGISPHTHPSAEPGSGCTVWKMSPEPEPAKRWDLWPAGGSWATASREDKSAFNVQLSWWGEG